MGKIVVIYRDKADNPNDQVHPWLLRLYEHDSNKLVDVIGTTTTTKAKSILKSWGFEGRVEWSRIHSGHCEQRYF